MVFMVKVMPWLLFALLVATWVPWRTIFEKVWGNNPIKAKVYVEAGEQIEVCNGRLIPGGSSTAVAYRYKCWGIWNTVIVPASYPYRYILGRRQIRVILGQATAAPLGGLTGTDVKVDGNMLDTIIRSKIGVELVRSIFGKAINIVQILIILGAVLFGGYFLYKNMIEKDTPAQQPAPAQQQPAPATIEEAIRESQ